MNRLQFPLAILLLFLCACDSSESFDATAFDQARRNGEAANEGFRRCMRFTQDWLTKADPVSGLIPMNLYDGKDIWDVPNAAADNYPFMVLTSFILDQELYHSTMREMLRTERALTSRLGFLPDSYSFSKADFQHPEIDTNRIVFGVSEYIKDGLIPLTEYTGTTPWSDRMIEMLDDLGTRMTIAQDFPGDFAWNPVEMEINGEMLQTLSRVFWITGEVKYIQWAIEIGDYYLLNDEQLLQVDRFRLRDHGCEIIGGLSELYVALHFHDMARKEQYQGPLTRILDRVLEIGRNPDGMFYNEVNMASGAILDSTIVDNWGYIYNAYYSVYLVDQQEKYRQAVLEPLAGLYQNYRNFNWEHGSADGFADAIESGINLYNRERVPELADWINSEIQVMWSLQDSSYQSRAQQWKGSGIIEGWHGDGNFARTTLMYCLWKTADLTVQPWREDVIIGATLDENALLIAMRSQQDWEGRLIFGKKRHSRALGLPIDYPRINQFPEWYYPDLEIEYTFVDNRGADRTYPGDLLDKGLEIKLRKGEEYLIRLEYLKPTP